MFSPLGLDGLDDRDPATLSGGQRQLLALATVLALAPKLLVLDEPTTDLDPLRVEELLATLDRLSRTRDLTLVFLGEDLRLARLCSRIVLLNRGKILADGPPEVILREVELLRGSASTRRSCPPCSTIWARPPCPSPWRRRWTRPGAWDGIYRPRRIPPCRLP